MRVSLTHWRDMFIILVLAVWRENNNFTLVENLKLFFLLPRARAVGISHPVEENFFAERELPKVLRLSVGNPVKIWLCNNII